MNFSVTLVCLGFLFGAVAGSFFNVIALRTVLERPWWGKERSCCRSCGRTLSTIDLIPILSWVILRGRCRTCKAPIPLRYPLVELVYGLWAAAALWRWGLSISGGIAILGGWLMMLNALTDLESGYIYDSLAASVGGVGLLVRLVGGWGALVDGGLGALAAASVIAVIIVLSRGGMGWGDATLMAGAGALLGWKMGLLATYLGFMIGGVSAVGLLITKKAARKDAVVLAPFLAAGVLCTLLWGPNILDYWGQAPGWPWS